MWRDIPRERLIAQPAAIRCAACQAAFEAQRLLGAWRDRPAARTEALHEVLVAVSRMLAELPMPAELDIDRLWVDEDGAVALDARVRLASGAPCGIDRFAIVPCPAEWVRELDWDGRRVTLRPIGPEDEPQHARFMAQASTQDLCMRFFCARSRFSCTPTSWDKASGSCFCAS